MSQSSVRTSPPFPGIGTRCSFDIASLLHRVFVSLSFKDFRHHRHSASNTCFQSGQPTVLRRTRASHMFRFFGGMGIVDDLEDIILQIHGIPSELSQLSDPQAGIGQSSNDIPQPGQMFFSITVSNNGFHLSRGVAVRVCSLRLDQGQMWQTGFGDIILLGKPFHRLFQSRQFVVPEKIFDSFIQGLNLARGCGIVCKEFTDEPQKPCNLGRSHEAQTAASRRF
jgi:hypothetical protein